MTKKELEIQNAELKGKVLKEKLAKMRISGEML